MTAAKTTPGTAQAARSLRRRMSNRPRIDALAHQAALARLREAAAREAAERTARALADETWLAQTVCKTTDPDMPWTTAEATGLAYGGRPRLSAPFTWEPIVTMLPARYFVGAAEAQSFRASVLYGEK